MNIYSIRGATTIESNTKQDIIQNAEQLLTKIIDENNIKIQNIVNIIFSTTKDITQEYPAVATRNIGITNCAIMCLQEMNVDGSLEMCIRVMITVMSINKDVKHIYLKKAKKLRPDIFFLQENGFSVAIDGPAGSGKSTVSKIIAKQLGFLYIDTGAMFRAVTLYCIENEIDCNDSYDVSLNIDKINISLEFNDTIQHIILNGKDITKKIRTQIISKNCAIIAKIPAVRQLLIKMQRNIANDKNVILDGRDIGTQVLPNANVKIYLDADIDERAKRRFDELATKDEIVEYESVRMSIIDRDNSDKNRKIAPLKKADDAIVINTTNFTIEEVSQKIINIIKEKIK